MRKVLEEDKKFDDDLEVDWEVQSLLFSGSLRRKDSSIFFPAFTSLKQMVTLRNKLFVDWTDQDSGKILVRAVTKVIASNTYLF